MNEQHRRFDHGLDKHELPTLEKDLVKVTKVFKWRLWLDDILDAMAAKRRSGSGKGE